MTEIDLAARVESFLAKIDRIATENENLSMKIEDLHVHHFIALNKVDILEIECADLK